MTQEEERKLVAEAQASLDAFNKLYDHYLPKIFKYIVNRVGNKDIGEDLTSKTFLKALDQLATFDNKRSFRAWIYSIAHNNIIDFYRKNREYTVDTNALEYFISDERSSEERALSLETTKKVLTVLMELPEPYQEVLSLRYFEEMDNGEIAELLECTVNNVNVKIHRALKAFEKKMKERTDLLGHKA